MTFAFFLESVGGGEWLVLLAVVLIVVGPKNLPSAARKIGQLMSQLRRAADEFKRQLMTMDQDVQQTINDVKNDYLNVGEEVQKVIEEENSGVSPESSAEDGSQHDDAQDDDSDRAMWESYGRDYPDYNPDGGYDGYSDEPDGEGEGADDVASAESGPSSESAPAADAAVAADAASEPRPPEVAS